MDALNERDWDRLTETIRRKRCILLLGPGVAVAPGDDQPIPLTTRLARLLAAQLPADVCDSDNLSHVSQLYYQISIFPGSIWKVPSRISTPLTSRRLPCCIRNWRNCLSPSA